MKMYQTKKIHYKAIFKQNEETETIEYKAKGILYKDKQTQVSFETKEGTICMTYSQEEVLLSHGHSQLQFHFDKSTWNDYQLHYGSDSAQNQFIKI